MVWLLENLFFDINDRDLKMIMLIVCFIDNVTVYIICFYNLVSVLSLRVNLFEMFLNRKVLIFVLIMKEEKYIWIEFGVRY